MCMQPAYHNKKITVYHNGTRFFCVQKKKNKTINRWEC